MAENEIRIKDLPSAQQINETDDVIVLDNATDGTRKLQGKVLLDMIHSAMAKGTTSGAVASFTDGADGIPMTDLVVSIEPQQDLHGYDSPWVGGSGKNKLPLTIDNIKTNNGGAATWSGNSKTINNVTFTILTDSDGNVTGIKANGTASNTTALFIATFDVVSGTQYTLNGCPANGAISTYELMLTIGGISTGAKENDYGNGVTYTEDETGIRGVQVVIRSGYNAQNLVFKPMIRLSSVTDATFAPYSNECPISGWDECNVSRTGKNLWTGTHGVITSCKIPKNTQFCVSTDKGSGTSQFYVYDENKTRIDYWNIDLIDGNRYYKTFTLNKDVYYVMFGSTVNTNYQINFGTDKEYTEKGLVYDITFQDGSTPLTVYGGTLDVLSGGLDEIQKSFTLDGTETISMGTSGGKTYFTASISSKIGGYSYNTSPTNKDLFISSHFKGDNSINYGNFYITGGGGTIVFLVEGITSESAMKTWLTNNTPQFVVPLATPQTYQLTPTEVKSLLGVNNIFADSGNILNAEYVRDTTTIINQILARLDALES